MSLPSERSTRLTNIQLSILKKIREHGSYKPKLIEEQSVRKLHNYYLVASTNGMLSLTPRGQQVLEWYELHDNPGEIRNTKKYMG